MTKTSLSRRISSAIASRSASRTVMVTISVPSGTSGSGSGSSTTAKAVTGVAVSVGASAGGASATGADSAAFGAAGAATAPALIAEASSPSDRITAIGVLTATSAVPSGTRILPSVPSSTASTSIVALSVSISAMTSPDFTLSPSCLTHLARLPFSIVGDRAGMSTWIGIGVLGSRLPGDPVKVGGGGPRSGSDEQAGHKGHHGLVEQRRLVGRHALAPASGQRPDQRRGDAQRTIAGGGAFRRARSRECRHDIAREHAGGRHVEQKGRYFLHHWLVIGAPRRSTAPTDPAPDPASRTRTRH